MKLTDGLFHKTFDAIAKEYPEIETDHWIIDIGAARLASNPKQFDVIVTGNLYGDIVSDIAAEVAGSVGLAPSANIGAHGAMFEAIHGSAPPLAGKDVANPSGLLLAGVMMLVHAGQPRVAERVHNAWLRTIEDGVHTADMPQEAPGAQRVGTRAFAQAVIERLGLEPRHLAPVRYGEATPVTAVPQATPTVPAAKKTVGVDVFVHWSGGTPDDLAALLRPAAGGAVELSMITNRGVKVWPQGLAETFCTDHWRCRFLAPDGTALAHAAIAALLARLAEAGLDFIKTEHLCTFDGVAGYSLGQGQ
jgi:isocitrate dehydrogenase